MPIQPLMRQNPLLRWNITFFTSFLLLLGCDGGSESPEEVPEVFSGSIDDRPSLAQVPGDARLKVGKELLVSGRLDESLIIFDTVLQDRPDLARAHFLKGMALHGKKSHAQALSQYLKAESLQQKFAEYGLLDYYIAWSAFYAGDSELSRVRVERSLQHAPEQADTTFLAGLLAFNDDRLEAAEDSFRRVLQYAALEPEPIRSRELRRAWIRLSDVLARGERQDEALEAITNAIEISPEFAESWFRKGSLLTRLGRDSEAEEALARWRELGGGSGS